MLLKLRREVLEVDVDIDEGSNNVDKLCVCVEDTVEEADVSAVVKLVNSSIISTSEGLNAFAHRLLPNGPPHLHFSLQDENDFRHTQLPKLQGAFLPPRHPHWSGL